MRFTLSSSNVVQYLHKQNFDNLDNVGSDRIELKYAKNFNLLVTLTDDDQLLVKQERHNAAGETAGEFLTEWKVKQFVEEFSELQSLRSCLPNILRFDPENSILVFHYLSQYRDLINFYVKEHQFPVEVAAALGTTIAQLHRATTDHPDYCKFWNAENTAPLPATNIGHITPEIFGTVPFDAIKFFALYQRYDSLGRAIGALMQTYTPRCLVHQDLKLNNVLLHLDWENPQDSLIRLIDWERAAWGDPAFDVGMIVASYLQLWLNSLIVSKDIAIEESLRLAMIPLDQLQPSIAALMQSYLEAFPEILQLDAAFVDRVVQFAGFALIGQIQAVIQYQKSFGNAGICLLQVAKSLLCRPEQSVFTVFGRSKAELLPKNSASFA